MVDVLLVMLLLLLLLLVVVVKLMVVLLLRMVVPILLLMLLEMVVVVVVTKVLVLSSEHAVVVRLEKDKKHTLTWEFHLPPLRCVFLGKNSYDETVTDVASHRRANLIPKAECNFTDIPDDPIDPSRPGHATKLQERSHHTDRTRSRG